jgi:hypothetical protein
MHAPPSLVDLPLLGHNNFRCASELQALVECLHATAVWGLYAAFACVFAGVCSGFMKGGRCSLHYQQQHGNCMKPVSMQAGSPHAARTRTCNMCVEFWCEACLNV